MLCSLFTSCVFVSGPEEEDTSCFGIKTLIVQCLLHDGFKLSWTVSGSCYIKLLSKWFQIWLFFFRIFDCICPFQEVRILGLDICNLKHSETNTARLDHFWCDEGFKIKTQEKNFRKLRKLIRRWKSKLSFRIQCCCVILYSSNQKLRSYTESLNTQKCYLCSKWRQSPRQSSFWLAMSSTLPSLVCIFSTLAMLQGKHVLTQAGKMAVQERIFRWDLEKQEDANNNGNSSRDTETNRVHCKAMFVREVANRHDGWMEEGILG